MKLPKILYTKLGRAKRWGQYSFDTHLIELDYRLKGKKHCEILIHESLHSRFPELTEESITEAAIYLTNILWIDGYRKVDNSNDIPLQDGSK